LATQLANIGDFAKAEKYFKHSIKLNKDSVPAHFGLGKIYMQNDRTKEAFEEFKLVTEKDAKHFKAFCQMGIIRLEEKVPEDAALYMKTCLSINPKYIPGIVAMGNLLYESGHSSTAAKYFT
jgi:tetratricopeptide (TPR) repeat protein